MARIARQQQHHRRQEESYTKIKELRGHSTWRKWHKEILVELDRLGLHHLLEAHLSPMSGPERQQYANDQKRAVGLLIGSTSVPVLQRLWACGWVVMGATLQATLALLEALLAEPESHPQQSHGTHMDIVDLTHTHLAPGTGGMDEYLANAEQCHLRLLARYGNGNGSAEELLEHLFTSSVLEGLKMVQPRDYEDWMYALDHDIPFPFLDDLVKMVKVPSLSGANEHHHGRRGGRRGGRMAAVAIELAVDPATAPATAAPRGPRELDARRVRRLERRGRRARGGGGEERKLGRGRGRGHRNERRYRGRDYPDVYRPIYPDIFVHGETDSHDRSHTLA